MALPDGVTTATVTAGVPVTHTGAPVKAFLSIEPSVFLVHTATGTPLVDFLEELAINEGVAGQFTLPHTDQAGFQDENGNAYTNWYYTARITYSTPSKAKTKAPRIKVFQLTTGQTSVDLDSLPGGAPALPYTAPIATVTSVNGRTGPVTIVDGDLPERLSEASLTADIAEATVTKADLASTRFKRLKARQAPIVRPQSFVLQPRVANVKPTITATNVPAITNETTIPFTVNGGKFNSWGSVGFNYNPGGGGWGAYDPHSPSYSPPWCTEFISDSPMFAPKMTAGGTTVDIWVDGELVYGAAALPSGGSYIKLNWNGVRRPRHYLIRGQGGFRIEHIVANVVDSFWAPVSDKAVTLGWEGDSYSQGTTNLSGIDTLPMTVANMLGWRLAASAQGGTGYDTPATIGTTASFKDRAADLVAAAPDVVVLAGGHNAADLTQAGQQPHIEATINTIKTGLPGVPIFVLGVMHEGDHKVSVYAPINAALQAACTATGATFIPMDGIVTGTGYGNDLHNDGNADVLIGVSGNLDNVHPNKHGTEVFAAHIVDRLTGKM